MPDPITIYSLSDSVVDNAGGRLLRVYGDFSGQSGLAYNIHVGPLGTVADPKVQSGKAGFTTDLYIWNTGELRGYLPRLNAGTSVALLVRRKDGVREQLIPNALQVVPQSYYGSVFDIRGILPVYYWVGPRNLENLEPTP